MSTVEEDQNMEDVCDNQENKIEILQMVKEHRGTLFTLRKRNQEQKKRIWGQILQKAQELGLFPETSQKIDYRSMSNKWYGWKNSAQKRFNDALKSGAPIEKEDFTATDQIILFDILNVNLPLNPSVALEKSDTRASTSHQSNQLDEELDEFSEIQEDVVYSTVGCVGETFVNHDRSENETLENVDNLEESPEHESRLRRNSQPAKTGQIQAATQPLDKKSNGSSTEIFPFQDQSFLHSMMLDSAFPLKYRYAFLENENKRQKLQLRIMEHHEAILREKLIKRR